jgi:hypothetical protein
VEQAPRALADADCIEISPGQCSGVPDGHMNSKLSTHRPGAAHGSRQHRDPAGFHRGEGDDTRHGLVPDWRVTTGAWTCAGAGGATGVATTAGGAACPD